MPGGLLKFPWSCPALQAVNDVRSQGGRAGDVVQLPSWVGPAAHEQLRRPAPAGSLLPAEAASQHMLGNDACLGGQAPWGTAAFLLSVQPHGQAFLGEHVSCPDLVDVHGGTGSGQLSPWKLC